MQPADLLILLAFLAIIPSLGHYCLVIWGQNELYIKPGKCNLMLAAVPVCSSLNLPFYGRQTKISNIILTESFLNIVSEKMTDSKPDCLERNRR